MNEDITVISTVEITTIYKHDEVSENFSELDAKASAEYIIRSTSLEFADSVKILSSKIVVE